MPVLKSDKYFAKRGIYRVWRPPVSSVKNSHIWAGYPWLVEKHEASFWFVGITTFPIGWTDFEKITNQKSRYSHKNVCFVCPYHSLFIILSDDTINFDKICGFLHPPTVAKRILLHTYPSYVRSSNYSYRYLLGKLSIIRFIKNICLWPNIRQISDYSAILPNIRPFYRIFILNYPQNWWI